MKRSITTDFEDENHIIHTNPAAFLLFDNVFPITICLKPDYFRKYYDAEQKILSYAKCRNIHLKLYIEHPDSNVHYHGWASFPYEKDRKNFQIFISRSIGKYYQSKKTDFQDTGLWVKYCMKSEGYYNSELENVTNIYKSESDKAARRPPPLSEDYIKLLRNQYGFDDEIIQLPEKEMEVSSM